MADNVAELTARAYAIAHAIPPGRVTTYGELTPVGETQMRERKTQMRMWPDAQVEMIENGDEVKR